MYFYNFHTGELDMGSTVGEKKSQRIHWKLWHFSLFFFVLFWFENAQLIVNKYMSSFEKSIYFHTKFVVVFLYTSPIFCFCSIQILWRLAMRMSWAIPQMNHIQPLMAWARVFLLMQSLAGKRCIYELFRLLFHTLFARILFHNFE